VPDGLKGSISISGTSATHFFLRYNRKTLTYDSVNILIPNCAVKSKALVSQLTSFTQDHQPLTTSALVIDN
jgi:hypothetical protein